MTLDTKLGLIVCAVGIVFGLGGYFDVQMMAGEADRMGMDRKQFRGILVIIGVVLGIVSVLLLTDVISVPEQPGR
jgi:hypothetical protein